MTEKVHQLKLAKATKEDFATLWSIYNHAQAISGVMQWSGTNLNEWAANELRHIEAIGMHFLKNPGAFSRVVMGAETLMSEKNGLIDQNSDLLEFNPDLVRKLEAIEHTIGWVQSVGGDIEAIRLLWDTVPEHRAPMVNRITTALKLLELVEGDHTKAFDLLKAPLLGEQSITVRKSCTACDYHGVDEECEVCAGEINFTEKQAIDWSTQKETLGMAFKALLSEVSNND